MPSKDYLTVTERLAILETKFDQMMDDYKDMVCAHKTTQEQLSQLLDLKSKGMGAIWLIGLIVGGGFMGAVGLITTFFNRGHL